MPLVVAERRQTAARPANPAPQPWQTQLIQAPALAPSRPHTHTHTSGHTHRGELIYWSPRKWRSHFGFFQFSDILLVINRLITWEISWLFFFVCVCVSTSFTEMSAEDFAGKLNIWSVTWCHQVEMCLRKQSSSEVTSGSQQLINKQTSFRRLKIIIIKIIMSSTNGRSVLIQRKHMTGSLQPNRPPSFFTSVLVLKKRACVDLDSVWWTKQQQSQTWHRYTSVCVACPIRALWGGAWGGSLQSVLSALVPRQKDR